MAGKYRRPATPEQRARADEARAEKLSALHDTLTEQVTNLAAGPQWRAWLDVASRFHRYSVNNTLLILAQRPQATQVAGYTLWQQLGRQVDKGEKGIAILAPVTRKPAAADSPTASADPSATAGVKTPAPANTDASGATDDGRRRVVGFRPTYVWDVAQTSGDPLPEPTRPELLAGQAPAGLWDALAAQCEAAGMTVRRHAVTPGGPNGWTDYAAHEVVVRDDVDDAQAVKTLAHELGHVLLHDPGQFDGEVTRGCRGTREVEAESVAYLVATAEGLDTSSYTFAYVAGWAQSTGHDVEATVRATAGRVLSAAHQVLGTIEDGRADLDEGAIVGADIAVVDQDIAVRASVGAERTGQLRAAAAASSTVPAAALTTSEAASEVQPARTDPERLHAVHTAAWQHYRSAARDSWVPGYLADRFGDVADALPDYGYARPDWTDLVDQLTAQGFDVDELVDAGVAVRARTGRVVDRFRDRLMVPIEDVDQRVIAFIGRRNPARDVATTAAAASGDRQLDPKYLNTATTSLYRKGDHLAGLGTHGPALAAGARPVLVEGPLDAAAVDAACRGAGERDAGERDAVGLACLGTAITDRQAAQLAACLPAGAAVVIATDADSAGDAAAARSYDVLTRHGLEPRRAALPAGTDPADLTGRGDAAALAAAIGSAEPLARHLAVAAVERFDLRWVEQQVAASRAAAAIIAKAPPATWLTELPAVADRTGLDQAQLTIAAAEHIAGEPSPDGDHPAPVAGPPGPESARGRVGAAAPPSSAARTAALSVATSGATAVRGRGSPAAAKPTGEPLPDFGSSVAVAATRGRGR